MTPADMGRAFSYFLAHRTCSTHPDWRRRRDGEAQVAEIVTAEVSGYQDFEEFLNVQGFTLRAYEQAAIGISGRGQIFVMARRSTDEQAAYVDAGWMFERMRDRRTTESIEDVVIWAAQLWATMQWFFYTRIDRGIDAVGRFKEAFVNIPQLAREVQEQIEKMRQRGAPADERGRAVWDVLTEGTASAVETKTRRFLVAMEEAMLVEQIGGDGEPQFRQTLNAAVEMSLNFERQAFYLMHAEDRGEEAVVGMIEGAGGSDAGWSDAPIFADETDVADDAAGHAAVNGGGDVGR